ncbi:hypothetical protein [Teredinibacter purpureus]|uniref:hypothetical protein n=1 Tax=Teredinibacter purpureus TaxID=2731756 RepID=UPI0019106E60|nr:hypothetical protein [Teredinibacter purpureus]
MGNNRTPMLMTRNEIIGHGGEIFDGEKYEKKLDYGDFCYDCWHGYEINIRKY